MDLARYAPSKQQRLRQIAGLKQYVAILQRDRNRCCVPRLIPEKERAIDIWSWKLKRLKQVFEEEFGYAPE